MMLAGRQRLRLRLRDGAALWAFLSVALSGALPVWAAAGFAIALLMSWRNIRPFDGRRAWSAVTLLVLAGGLFGFALAGWLDLIIAAVSFAVLVTAHRLLSDTTPVTNRQVLVSSLLMMAGGAALTGELWYAICLFGFGLCATMHLGLAAIEGPVERDTQLPVAPVVRQLSIGVFFALVGGLAFFILFPRVSWNMAARRSGPGLLGAAAGMSDRVRLGGSGTIKTNARVVARVTMEPDVRSDSLDAYWPGRTFDAFDGKEWVGSGVAKTAQPSVFWAEAAGRKVTQHIELTTAYDARTLIGLQRPITFSQAKAITTGGSTPISLIKLPGEEVRFGLNAQSYTYQVVSSPELAAPGEQDIDPKYLALPPLDARVAPLAATLAGNTVDPANVAQRLEAGLRSRATYTLELSGDVADPLADFLFERKAGHCEHFATALAVLLRTRGIGARVVTGFYGGERVGEQFVLRAGDAHAWVEAWVPGRGWVALDATPSAGRRARPLALLALAISAYEWLETTWRNRVVDYSIQDQVGFVRTLVRPPAERATGPTLRTPPRAWLGGLAVAVVVYWVIRRIGRPRAQKQPASRWHDELLSLVDALGLRTTPGEPLEELSRRLTATQHPLATEVRTAVSMYLAARFAGHPIERVRWKQTLSALHQRSKRAAA